MGPYKTPSLLSGAGVGGENGLLDFPNSTLASASVCLRMLSSCHHIDEGYSFRGAGYSPKQSVYPHYEVILSCEASQGRNSSAPPGEAEGTTCQGLVVPNLEPTSSDLQYYCSFFY